MLGDFLTLIVTAIVAYALVDAIRLLVRKDFYYPTLALIFSIYNAIRLHANVFALSGVKFYGTSIEAYILSGIIASLGAKEIYTRFGDFVKPKNGGNENKSKQYSNKKLKSDNPNRVLGG